MPDTGLSVTSIRGYILVFRDTGEDVILTRIRVSATSPCAPIIHILMNVKSPRCYQRLAHEEGAFKSKGFIRVNPFGTIFFFQLSYTEIFHTVAVLSVLISTIRLNASSDNLYDGCLSSQACLEIFISLAVFRWSIEHSIQKRRADTSSIFEAVGGIAGH